MGQKVNPNGIRLGINKTWSSRWFSKSEYAKLLHQDLEIKKYVEQKLKGEATATYVFGIGGLGQQLTYAIFARQYIALQSYVALIAIAFILFTVLADLLIGVVDPRTRNRHV